MVIFWLVLKETKVRCGGEHEMAGSAQLLTWFPNGADYEAEINWNLVLAMPLKAYPSSLHLSARTHVQKVPQPPKTAPPDGHQVFKSTSPWLTFYI